MTTTDLQTDRYTMNVYRMAAAALVAQVALRGAASPPLPAPSHRAGWVADEPAPIIHQEGVSQ